MKNQSQSETTTNIQQISQIDRQINSENAKGPTTSNKSNSDKNFGNSSQKDIDKLIETIHENGMFKVVTMDPIYTDEEIKIIIDKLINKYKDQPIHPNELRPFAEITSACKAEPPTTMSIRNCLNENYEFVDKSLNHNYQLVMKLITKEERNKLRNFQRKWIKDRKLYSAQFASRNYGGTLSPIDVMSSYEQWTFDRFEQLFDLFNIIKHYKSCGEAYPVFFE